MMLALPHLCRWNLPLHKSRFSFYSIGHFKRTTIINTFGPYNGSKMMPWDSLHLLNMIMCQLGRAGFNDPGSSPQFAQSCQLLQDGGWREERVHNLVTILRGGGRWLGGGAVRAKRGFDPQLALVHHPPTFSAAEEGSSKQWWPLDNRPLMGGSSGMDCIRAPVQLSDYRGDP